MGIVNVNSKPRLHCYSIGFSIITLRGCNGGPRVLVSNRKELTRDTPSLSSNMPALDSCCGVREIELIKVKIILSLSGL